MQDCVYGVVFDCMHEFFLSFIFKLKLFSSVFQWCGRPWRLGIIST